MHFHLTQDMKYWTMALKDSQILKAGIPLMAITDLVLGNKSV